MTKTLKALSARVTALEKTVAKFLASEVSEHKAKTKRARPKTKKKSAAKKVRVRPPTAGQLVPGGMPDFVSPMDKL